MPSDCARSRPAPGELVPDTSCTVPTQMRSHSRFGRSTVRRYSVATLHPLQPPPRRLCRVSRTERLCLCNSLDCTVARAGTIHNTCTAVPADLSQAEFALPARLVSPTRSIPTCPSLPAGATRHPPLTWPVPSADSVQYCMPLCRTSGRSLAQFATQTSDIALLPSVRFPI